MLTSWIRHCGLGTNHAGDLFAVNKSPAMETGHAVRLATYIVVRLLNRIEMGSAMRATLRTQ